MAHERKHGNYSTRGTRNGIAGLTRLQLNFIDQYVIDHNGTKAAIRAGYSKNSAGETACRLLKNPGIRGEIDRREEARAERLDIDSDAILRELKRIAFFDIRKLWDPVTKKLRTDPMDMNEDDARALVNFDIIVLNRDGDHIVKLCPGNKIRALELLGKYKRLFTDKVDINATTTVNFVADYGDGEELAVGSQ